MKVLRFAVAIAAVAGLSEAQGHNRLALSNGGDFIDVVQSPYVGGDPNNDDYSGDAFYKVWPSYALQRCGGVGSGSTNFITGLEWYHYDQDWSNDSTLWAQLFSTATDNGTGALNPDTADTTAVRLDEVTPTGFPPVTTCPGGGLISGYIVQSDYFDTAGVAIDPGFVRSAETGGHSGAQDHVALSTYAPVANASTSSDLDLPLLNSCLEPGDASFGWLVSTGGGATVAGEEKEVNWLGTGESAFGGFQVGPGGGWTAYPIGDAGEVAMFLDDVVLEPTIDVGTGLGPENGMGALQVPLGYVNGGAAGAGLPISFAFTVRDDAVVTDTTDFSFVEYHLLASGGTVLNPQPIDFGFGCDTTSSVVTNPDALWAGNPIDGLGSVVHGVWLISTGLSLFGDESEGTSLQVPLTIPSPATTTLANARIGVQGYSVSGISGLGRGSQLFRFTMRYDDGCGGLGGGVPCVLPD